MNVIDFITMPLFSENHTVFTRGLLDGWGLLGGREFWAFCMLLGAGPLIRRPQQPGHHFRVVKGGTVLVNAIDIVSHPDIEIMISVYRGVVVPVGGDGYPFSIGKADEGGYFLAAAGIPQADRAVIGSGKDIPVIGAEDCGSNFA